MDRKLRKSFKHTLLSRYRLIEERGVYHVMQRAPGCESLFNDDIDRKHFIRLLRETAEKFEFQVYAFVLMDNHFHLQIRLSKGNLSLLMKNLAERYAWYFNKKYNRMGHVFQGRFRAGLCDDERYILATSLYIHLNPYRAGLQEELGTYRWSTERKYTSGVEKDSFVKPDFILQTIDVNSIKAREAYAQTLQSYLRTIKGDTSERWGRILSKDRELKRGQVLEQIRAGMSYVQICNKYGISRTTLYRLIRK